MNLGLEILGRREDRFHQIASIMLAIDLYDEVEIFTREETTDSVIGEGFCRTGLTDQAMETLCDGPLGKFGLQARVRKKIPVAAGLGGGSSNAAVALTGANLMSGSLLSQSDLWELARKLGSDVAFFLSGGCALVEGRGEICASQLPVPDVWIVLANPGFELSTSDVFGELSGAEFTTGSRTRELVDSIESGRGRWSLLHNGLQAAAERLCPSIRPTLEAIRKLTSRALVSGSGATCFGVFESEEAASMAESELAGAGYWTWSGRPLGSWTIDDLRI